MSIKRILQTSTEASRFYGERPAEFVRNKITEEICEMILALDHPLDEPPESEACDIIIACVDFFFVMDYQYLGFITSGLSWKEVADACYSDMSKLSGLGEKYGGQQMIFEKYIPNSPDITAERIPVTLLKNLHGLTVAINQPGRVKDGYSTYLMNIIMACQGYIMHTANLSPFVKDSIITKKLEKWKEKAGII